MVIARAAGLSSLTDQTQQRNNAVQRLPAWIVLVVGCCTARGPCDRGAASSGAGTPCPRYTLIDLGTLSGPNAYFNLPGQTMNRAGVVEQADLGDTVIGGRDPPIGAVFLGEQPERLVGPRQLKATLMYWHGYSSPPIVVILISYAVSSSAVGVMSM